MKVWRMSKLKMTPLLVTIIGAILVSLAATFMVSQTLQAASDDGGGSDWRGLVQTKPAAGFVGNWVIGGRTFSATNATEINQSEGALEVGSCAKVRYQVVDGGTNRALQIERQSANDCSENSTPTPESSATPDPNGTIPPDDHGGHGGDNGENHSNDPHGRIESLPTGGGLLGTWVISGTTYVVATTTELRQRFGSFKVGACVQIKSDKSTTPATAQRIETKQDFVCSSDDDHGNDDHGGGHHDIPPGLAHGELFGLLQSFPMTSTTLTGTWKIGGLNFIADANTELDQEHGAFTISSTVEVSFYIDIDGVNHAIRIESKFANDHHGHDDDGNGVHEGAEGQAFGTLTSFPDGLVGPWVISGVEYTATNQTEFKPRQGAFAVGVRVKVEYFLDANNHRIAHEVETTTNTGGVDDPTHAVLVGFVQVMPTDGFTGTWQIGDVTFVADLNSQFKEEHGLLAKGAFVSVEYSVTNGSNLIYQLETHVPPGAGDHSHTGRIKHMSDDGLQAAGVSANSVWSIDDTNYVVTPSTSLNDVLGALAVDQSVIVNSYTAADGTEVATQIRGLTVNSQVFLPLMMR